MYGNEEFNLSCPDFQNRNFFGYDQIVSYQSHKPSVTPPTDTIMTANAPTGLVNNPEQSLSYPIGHMYYRYGWAIPSGNGTTASVTFSPNTKVPASVFTSKTLDMMHHYPQMSYPVGPMLYHHKPKPYGSPWAFLAKSTTTAAPTTKTATTLQTTPKTATIVARNPQQYPFIQMYYPFGTMPYPYRPMLDGYPWAFPTKAPTTAPTTTTPTHKTLQTTATTSTTVASNGQQSSDFFNQVYYPYGCMPHLYKSMPYGYPCAFSANAPMIAPTTTAPTTKTTTISQTSTTSAIVANTPQQSAYFFNRMHYAYGSMPYQHKPMTSGYPWAFPARKPTAAPTAETTTALTTKMAKTSQTTSTTLPHVANNYKQSVYPFNRLYYTFGPMHCHHRPSHYLGYPWALPANAPSTTTVKTSPITPSHRMYYPYVYGHFAKPLPPWIHFNHNHFQKDQELVPTSLAPVIK